MPSEVTLQTYECNRTPKIGSNANLITLASRDDADRILSAPVLSYPYSVDKMAQKEAYLRASFSICAENGIPTVPARFLGPTRISYAESTPGGSPMGAMADRRDDVHPFAIEHCVQDAAPLRFSDLKDARTAESLRGLLRAAERLRMEKAQYLILDVRERSRFALVRWLQDHVKEGAEHIDLNFNLWRAHGPITLTEFWPDDVREQATARQKGDITVFIPDLISIENPRMDEKTFKNIQLSRARLWGMLEAVGVRPEIAFATPMEQTARIRVRKMMESLR